jgi:single-stranded-DNA-specific exonuclease
LLITPQGIDLVVFCYTHLTMALFSVKEEVEKEKLEKAFGDLDIHPLTARLLLQRGVKNRKSAEEFLNPSYERDIGDPFLIYGMTKAVERIVKGMKKGEKIAIYSDYDCDGIPGGVLLRTFFDDIGYPVEMYIPHRHNEGYGLHNHAIDALKAKGVSLIITVDLAITNIDEVAYAKKQGIDFIVTDHHLPIHSETKKGKKQVVPDAVAVINSKQDECKYHDDMLCGCAVAWKLSCALLSELKKEKKSTKKDFQKVLDKIGKLKEGYEKWLLDLVGISTISDMVPLVKENRALAHFGLKVLRQTKRAGLNHIFFAQGISKEHLVEDDIAFTIAPRINAASRMGNPIQAHNMLYEKSAHTAGKLVEDLELLNSERKLGVKDILSTISFDHEVYKNNIVVVGDVSWGPGILGLIAQNIIDETGKPTFVYGQGDDKTKIKGSCRSRGDVHVVELMAKARELYPEVILYSGGHEQAGGFECALDKIGELSNVLNEALKHVEVKDLGKEETVADAYLNLEDVNHVTHNAIQMLAPFGVGNAKPLFAFKDVTPASVRWFGKKGEHLEVLYPQVKAILFFAPRELEEKVKKPHTLLAHIEKSYFRGKGELRLRIKEVR